jgi:4-alpha-glucanotransferase
MQFAHRGKFLSGIVAPLAALRSAGSPAVGEFPDLPALAELAASWDLGLIQLLPVNDSGAWSSPYSALSAFALHPLHLGVAALPESGGPGGKKALAASAELAAAHASRPRLDYGALRSGKLAILRALFEAAWGTGRAGSRALEADPGFAAWLAGNAWVKAYAVFTELKEGFGGLPWWDWPTLREPAPGEIEGLWAGGEVGDGARFQAWLQWRAEGQFAEAAAALARKGIDLMGDLPILLGLDSADVWSRREVFSLELRAGAPPDGGSPLGQNWGFPLYDWEGGAAFEFWRERLAAAGKFYSAYRIDHVLGFFRIWGIGARERSGWLGRYLPDRVVGRAELQALGFSADRLRWLSEPHIPGWRLLEAAKGDAMAAAEARAAALDRIGDEELYLFKRGIRGELDIEELARSGAPGYGGPGFADSARDFLLAAWRDRCLLEFAPGSYAFAPNFRGSSAWASLGEGERQALEGLARRGGEQSERLWAENGRRLIGKLREASDMLACAEDLGAVPDCVPGVLAELGVLGLRVLRWTREWWAPGQPHVAARSFPRLSVACASVHDSSNLREWWEAEADRPAAWAFVAGALGVDPGPLPARLDPEAAETLLRALSASNSAIVVHALQDLLAMAPAFQPADPREERVNIPGRHDDWNWGWRFPATIEELSGDARLGAAVRRVVAARPRGKA